MARYCIAYKNEQTVTHAERTGNLAKGWVRVTGWSSQDDIRRIFDRMVREGQYNNSIIGIFIAHENELTAWYDRTPRKAHDSRDKSAWEFKGLRGLINSRSSADL